jgi:hypothetical protein
MSQVAIALVHHPVLDRQGAVITTAITNLDLHDLARSACTHGVSSVFIVHPVAAQRELALRIQNHWVNGSGARRIPTREPAMSLLSVVESIEDAYQALGGRQSVDLYVTSAKSDQRGTMGYPAARARIAKREAPSLIVFGTGWGLAPNLLDQADVFLEPLKGAHPEGYNHLSVRAACAIILDRLLARDQ